MSEAANPVSPDEQRTDESWGILPSYIDTSGQAHPVSSATRTALRQAMGFTAGQLCAEPAERVFVVRPGETVGVSEPMELVLEDGTSQAVSAVTPPDLPLGYHRLRPRDSDLAHWLICCPHQCHPVPAQRNWGWSIQLYALRSRRSWGLGDLRDLQTFAQWAALQGADVILVNPLNAVAPVTPQQPSPYFPISRRFRNPLYLDIESVPGAHLLGEDLARLAQLGQALNRDPLIRRDEVFRLKMQALEQLWPWQPHSQAFVAYCQQQGESLRLFATFCLLARQYGTRWRQWPAEYRRPDHSAVAQLAAQQARDIEFHQWLQWLLDEQIARCAVTVPLVMDLPIGVDPDGADAWQWQDLLAERVSLGAPPDQFNADGQKWELPPFIPHRLRAAGYQPFRETLRAAMRHAGGLRIDHAMGLFRLFWIPDGQSPQQGAYVRYGARELLAILALESQRAGAWIAGEDLGTVEGHVRDELAAHGILSYRLLWFEDPAPQHYPETTMAAITTHDLPTVAGLWTGSDMAARRRLELPVDETGYAQMRWRLETHGGVSADMPLDTLIQRAHAALAGAGSRVRVACLEDALAVVERPNMPGTTHQWPNWCQALPVPLEQIVAAPLPNFIASLMRGPEGLP